MNSYVTIITQSHLPYAIALFESLLCHSKAKFDFHCLIAEEDLSSDFKLKMSNVHLSFIPLYLNEIVSPFFEPIYDKYYLDKKNEFRWSMKPVIINHLLANYNYKKVIYLDADLYFFNEPDFLFELLEKDRVLLSPHWRCSRKPELDWFNFVHNFKHGIYNGGFIGVNLQGQEIMEYWANLCLTACEQNTLDGLHDDQKYLDIFQSCFEGVGVIRHKGCNVSNWNQIECARTILQNGEVLINSEYPIVFIHFTEGTIIDIVNNKDAALSNHLKLYNQHLINLGGPFDIIEKAEQKYEDLVKQIHNQAKLNTASKKTNFMNWAQLKNVIFK